MSTQRRNRRSGVEDLWKKRNGAPTARDGRGLRWRARIVDDDGQERTRAFRIRPEAVLWVNEQTTRLGTGTYADPNIRTTVSVVTDGFLASQGHLKERTRYEYRSLAKAMILPKWGERRVNDIRRSEVEAWLAVLVEGGKSGSRVRQAGRLLSQIMEYARADRMIATNPVAGVKLPRERKERPDHYLTAEQVWELSDAVGEPWDVLVRTLGFTGLRWGELSALTVSDIDFERQRFMVSKAYSDIGGRLVLGSTKTHEARWVPIPAGLGQELGEAVEGRPGASLVFHRGGEPVSSAYFLRSILRPAAESVKGIPDALVTHDLRHTAASLAIRGGVHVKTLQRMLGHKTATLTLDRYGHLFADDLDAAGVVMDALAYRLRTGTKKKTGKPSKKVA